MKWFKHMSDASDDAFIEELEDKFGWEGYGRWWKLLEIIARAMDKNNEPFAIHSWVKWSLFLKGKRNKVSLFLVALQDQGKITLEQNGDILKITCPKLLELRDEYTKRSGHPPDISRDKLPARVREKSKDTDIRTLSSESVVRARDPIRDKNNLDLHTLTVVEVTPFLPEWAAEYPVDLELGLQNWRSNRLTKIALETHWQPPPDWITDACSWLRGDLAKIKRNSDGGNNADHGETEEQYKARYAREIKQFEEEASAKYHA